MPAVKYIPKPNSLIKFCDFLTEQFTINLEFERYVGSQILLIKNLFGGIGDMSHFSMLNEKYKITYDLCKVLNHFTYDTCFKGSINSIKYSKSIPLSSEDLQDYVMDEKKGTKKFIMRGGIPHGILKQSKKEIKFKSIHFQGQSNRFIPYFFTGNFFKKLMYIRRFKKEKY